MTLKHLSKSTKRCYKSESLLRVTQILRPAPEARRLLVILVRINKLHQNISGAVYKKRSTWAQKTKGCTVVCIFLVVQSQCDLGHIKQRKDVKKKAMWNVQCIEVWRATFMTSPPVSPVRWFLLTAKDFSPEFLFSSAWFCQSWSPPRDLACQTCLQ